MTEEEIANMSLHRVYEFGDGIKVLKVPTGWLYQFYEDETLKQVIFVPGMI